VAASEKIEALALSPGPAWRQSNVEPACSAPLAVVLQEDRPEASTAGR
jgi:hypothetical protein